MLTAELKVNGINLAHVTVYNKGKDVDDKTKYWVEAYMPSDDGEEKSFLEQFWVSHKRSDGAFLLIEKVFSIIRRKIKHERV